VERRRAIDLAIRDALSMTFITAKSIKRGNSWRAMGHLDHVDRILGGMAWILEHNVRPGYADPIPRMVPAAIPGTREGQMDTLRHLFASFEDLLEASGCAADFERARTAVKSALCDL
jgi:hypothetical protein